MTLIIRWFMNAVWTKEIDDILKIGQSLKFMGISNWALCKSDALKALTILETINIGVLGGDVYLKNKQLLDANYDSWHCDRLNSEVDLQYVERSIAKAKKYIESYPNVEKEVFFSIVPDVKSRYQIE